MAQVPARDRPASHAAFLALVLAATWIYDYIQHRQATALLLTVGVDAGLALALVLLGILVFSQFSLPVRGISDRLRVAGRVWLHAWGAHGTAVFVQNGRVADRRRAGSNGGPGMLWIDSASAVLTRSSQGRLGVLGPGVHFTERGERVDRAFSLHVQACLLGPGQDEPIFAGAEVDDDEGRASFEATQARRRAVSALTRDGHEIVPEIRLRFRLDGQPSTEGGGSSFGFSPEAVERAARSEGLRAEPGAGRPARVAWNQLPGLIAADLWREYVAKFTLDDMLTARFEPIPSVLQPQNPAEPAAVEDSRSDPPRGEVARLLWRVNNEIERNANRRRAGETRRLPSTPSARPTERARGMQPGRSYTGLQIVEHMVRARLMDAIVAMLDETGRHVQGHIQSEEFEHLRERGIRILDASITNPRFSPDLERQLVDSWKTAWLENASEERGHAEQLELLAAESGKQQALIERGRTLATALLREEATSVPTALREILRMLQAEILSDERLQGRGAGELDAISKLAHWTDRAADA